MDRGIDQSGVYTQPHWKAGAGRVVDGGPSWRQLSRSIQPVTGSEEPPLLWTGTEA